MTRTNTLETRIANMFSGALEYAKQTEIVPKKPFFYLLDSDNPKPNLKYLENLFKNPELLTQTQRLQIQQSINYFRTKLEESKLRDQTDDQEEVIIKTELTLDQIRTIENLVENFNLAESKAKFDKFLHLFNFLELQINMGLVYDEKVQDILGQIHDKDGFKRSLKGLAYGRGGNMTFPNALISQLN